MPRVFVRSAVVRSPCCIFSWRDAAHQCGWHDKNDPLFGGFSSLRSLKIGISPGRKKVIQGKPTEKWVVFIRAGKPCCPSSIQGASAGKGSPRDSAWIMFHRTRNSLNLSKASQFGSTLAGRRPIRDRESGVRCALGFAASRSLARASLFGFLGGMLSFFPPENDKIDGSG